MLNIFRFGGGAIVAGRKSGAESQTHTPPLEFEAVELKDRNELRDRSYLGSVPLETIPHPEGLPAVPKGEPEAVWVTAVTMDQRSEVWDRVP